MKLKQKTLRRDEWKRVTQKTVTMRPVRTPLFSGLGCLITIHAVEKPLWVPSSPFGPILIADKGYRWLQFEPEGEHWCLTVMFDEKRRLTQSYFDITRRNDLSDPENAYFEDMFLDVAIPAVGEPAVLDRDELDAALADGSISGAEHALALETADRILSWYAENREQYVRFLYQTLEQFIADEQI